MTLTFDSVGQFWVGKRTHPYRSVF